ncbi:glycoside hydrolase family 2 protein [Periconia macrospinosa]|uniref:Glycoside hydrolase family 2 protein n=1 Tax=Periconia macrospinosa TaxID=97972 RepID=A0A2V1E6K3_9PLEO|nr:glycoside hydrolase family 2 protein [Periconia macrospinosa]
MHFPLWITALSLLGAATASSFKRQADGPEYQLKTGPLDTDWTKQVGTNPWPEYPRPQLARSEWKNLNGVWQYQNASGGAAELATPPFNKTLSEAVLVPFCLESALSGIMGSNLIHSWYRTLFDVPSSWFDSEKRVLLNFGAVDYQTSVFVNGKLAGNNTGGYFHFALDVTDLVNTNGTNELIVYTYDPTNTDGTSIPLGKQRLNPDHINYTPCSGIWQTVWLESAGRQYITQLDIDAKADGSLNITVHTSGDQGNSSVGSFDITVHSQGAEGVALQETGQANAPTLFKIDSPQVWSPDSPNLYNVTVKLGSDTVTSYTGFRTLSKGVIDSLPRPLLNGEFVFQFGPLDQGYWPDGLHSPPTYEAMVSDLKAVKEVGFNMVRKHIKIEPGLFYRACDELGIMVVQDMPAMPTYPYPYRPACTDGAVHVTPEQQQEFERELARMVEQLKSHPSITTWVIYNEGWGQSRYDRTTDVRLTSLVRSLDPTRLINTVSGWHDHGAGDFHDNHHYSFPQCGTPFWGGDSGPFDASRIGFQGEFGGVGNNVSIEHLWNVPHAISQINQTYELAETLEGWNFRVRATFADLRSQVEAWSCSGAVYTQTTDVEGEVNGLLTYDRRVNRMDVERWKGDIEGMYEAARNRGTVPDGGEEGGEGQVRRYVVGVDEPFKAEMMMMG